jgi:hypothetical protein
MAEEAIRTETKDKKVKNKKKGKGRGKSEEKPVTETNEIDDEPVEPTKEDKEDDKETKKKDRKRHRGDGEDDDDDDESDVEDANKDEGDTPGKSKKRVRAERKKEKEFLLAKVPKVDKDGVIYTKLQIRRMTKRVKRGLAPVPTAKEENDRLRRDAELRREDDVLYTNEDEQDDDDDDDEEDKAENGDAMDEDNGIEKNGKFDASEDDKDEANDEPKMSVANPSPNKKAKRNKPVPEDYVCSACKNKHAPVHWIYDCPEKITKKGTNQKKKKLRGLNEPDAKKVFISGLPFEAKTKDVESLFRSCGTIAFCKLITFEDTGRCKGNAYISFDTEDAAKKALKLSGTTIDNIVSEDTSKKSKKDEAPKRKDLKLKVSKVLNRRFTHKKA